MEVGDGNLWWRGREEGILTNHLVQTEISQQWITGKFVQTFMDSKGMNLFDFSCMRPP